jgi:single-stranded-DNA-specific exonuclease
MQTQTDQNLSLVTESSAREWSLKECGPSALGVDWVQLGEQTGLSQVTLKLCVSRGLNTSHAIQDYLAPRLESLTDPMRIRDMDRALDRLVVARELRQKIRIYGDYDVDGTTGAALLTWFFRDCGFDFDAKQPDRFKDGYGLNVPAVESAAAEGVKLLVTVDCGITSFASIERAHELGVDVIVVDHHQLDPEKGLPSAHAVLNPQRSDCESGLRQLCGCGVAFYLIRALRTRGRELNWWPAGKEPNLKQHLDLVVMATAADMVPLTGDNHTLARHGMDVLKMTKKPGVRALLDAAGVAQKEISPSALGFLLGPRINASGRMGSASLALELLTTQDEARAQSLAHELERVNQERADLQNRIWDEVRAKVEAGMQQGRYTHGIAVADPGWHEGVVGIVASRVTETFRKPAAVVALREDYGKGSVRSWAGKDVLAALRACAPLLRTFGGHKHAAGLSVELEHFEAFAQAFDQALGELHEDAASRPLLIDAEVSLRDLDIKTLQELENLGPFGPGNPEPVFSASARVIDHRVLKERHLKFTLEAGEPSGEGERGALFEGIWFHGAERKSIYREGVLQMEWAQFAGVPELNRFRGRVTPSFRIKDCRPVTAL